MNAETIIVTGASGSIGAEIVKSLLKKNFAVVMAVRNIQKGEAVRTEILNEIKGKENFVWVEELDLASLTSIRKFVGNISGKSHRLVGLMNNAGTLNRTFVLTPEGFENTIGVNYIGTFLLTNLLIPLLEKGAGITNVVSMTANPKRMNEDFFHLSPEKFRQVRSYGQSKTALMLFTASLAERYKGIFRVNASDPGVVDTDIIHLDRWFDLLTDIMFRPFIKSPRKGAIPLVNALLAKQTGMLFWGNKSKNIPQNYTWHPLKEWLWEETERRIAEIKAQSIQHFYSELSFVANNL